MAGLGFDHGDVFAGPGQVGEAGVAELVQGVAPGGRLPDLLGPSIRQPGLPRDRIEIGSSRGQVGAGLAVPKDHRPGGAAVDGAGEASGGDRGPEDSFG